MLIAIGLVALGCGGEAGEPVSDESAPEEMTTEATPEETGTGTPEAWCCELRAANGYLVDHLCLLGATERPGVSADYRCWEVP